MKTRYQIISCIIFGLACTAHLSAQDSSATPKIEWSGMAALVEGQFVKCDYIGGEPMPFRPWVTDEYVRVGAKARINRNFSVSIVPQVELWNDTWDWTTANASYAGFNPLNQHATVSFADAEGILHFGNADDLALNVAAGVIPYKYDDESKNLGEYLFRTGEHPTYIFNSFDQAYVTLTGVRVNAEIMRNFSADIFLTTETQVQPMNDWSLSFLFGYKLPGFIDAGAGIMFDRLFPAVPLLDKQASGKLGTYYSSSGQLDTFSWGGTKVMARVAFDPKGFLPRDISSIFGQEDGKIYGEAAILGVNDIHPYNQLRDSNTGLPVNPPVYVPYKEYDYYSNIKQRIPVMFGINIPTMSPLLKDLLGFSILDYLSAEFEWFGDPYAPGAYTEESFQYFLPLPNGLDPANSHWKYSFNFKKTIAGHMFIIGQIARDHTRHDAYSNWFSDGDEIFQTKDEWGWWLKLQYNL